MLSAEKAGAWSEALALYEQVRFAFACVWNHTLLMHVWAVCAQVAGLSCPPRHSF
jgi:hypothetical protein